MNTLNAFAYRTPQLYTRLGLVGLVLLMIGTHGCNFFGPVSLGCEEIPITVAPMSCTAFQTPQCFGSFSGENPVIDIPSGDFYVIGDEQMGFQFCASEFASNTPAPESVPYVVTGNLGRFGHGEFIVTVEGQVEATVEDSPDPVTVGNDLTYTITLLNRRQSVITVDFTNRLPESVTLVSVLPSNCVLQGRDISCDSVNIGAPTVTYQFVVRPTTPGTITNEFVLNAHSVSPITITNDTTVNPANSADLLVTVIDTPDPVIRGAALTYTITVTNNGPATATGVQLTNRLPPLEIFNLSVSQGSSSITSGNTVVCNFGTLASGASATLTYTGNTFITGTIINTATVTANEPDPDTVNNTGSASTIVNPP